MILVDTDILIAHLRGVAPARSWLRSARSQGSLGVSVVTVAELIGGMRSDERGPVGRLLGAFEVRPVTDLVARQAGDLRRQYRRSHQGIGLADYLIAATALEDGSDLATLNVRHFPMFPMLMAPFSTT